MLNRGVSPIQDAEIESFLKNKELKLTATTDRKEFYRCAELVVVATPTDYDPVKNYFDTSTVEVVIEEALALNPQAVIVIKSTVPVGYTEMLKERYDAGNIIFSPEFLREGKVLYDNLYSLEDCGGGKIKPCRNFCRIVGKGCFKR